MHNPKRGESGILYLFMGPSSRICFYHFLVCRLYLTPLLDGGFRVVCSCLISMPQSLRAREEVSPGATPLLSIHVYFSVVVESVDGDNASR